ncbi:hypothetical protein RF11_05249 [Thelohanellus kitauei]|uniref:Uncharacterized protein n=1 Tax=Thelohanellus kitauei TaxID=669202 RepID=A0A0C2J0K2_THEKT|nr:hypothetical protein RF11_05249 [Thelohanellus kitauei]
MASVTNEWHTEHYQEYTGTLSTELDHELIFWEKKEEFDDEQKSNLRKLSPVNELKLYPFCGTGTKHDVNIIDDFLTTRPLTVYEINSRKCVVATFFDKLEKRMVLNKTFRIDLKIKGYL